MVNTLSSIRTELETIAKWNRQFVELTLLDEVGRQCRKIRREELLSMFYRLAARN